MILVSDMSVLIDLERGGLLDSIFGLPHAFAVPDILYHQEMKGEWGQRLVALGLRVEEVSEAGVGNALRYRKERKALSVADSFALADVQGPHKSQRRHQATVVLITSFATKTGSLRPMVES